MFSEKKGIVKCLLIQTFELKLTCVVFSLFQVKWYRETMLVVPNEYRYTEHFGIRHTLVLRKVQREDFGNYSCRAENSLGRSRAFIELSGKNNRVEKFVFYMLYSQSLPYIRQLTSVSQFSTYNSHAYLNMNQFQFVVLIYFRCLNIFTCL